MTRTKIKLSGDPKTDLEILFKECSNNNQICFHIKKNKPLVDYLKQKTGLDSEPMVLLYHFKENIKEIPKCVCGNERQYHCYGYRPTCGDKKCQNIVREESKKKFCLEKYGVEFVTQLEIMKEKSKQTCLDRYGVKNYSMTNEYIERVKSTNKLKYGFEYVLQSPEILNKSKKTMIEKYGVSIPIQSISIKEKIKNTNLERYLVDNPMKSAEMVEKSKKTNLEKLGVDNPMKSNLIKDKLKKSLIKKYGVDSFSKTDEFKNKLKKTSLENWGVDNPSKSEEIRKSHKISNHVNYIKYTENNLSLFKCDYGKEHDFLIKSDAFIWRIKYNLPLCTICNPIGDSISIKEQELYEFIKSV